MSNTSRQQGQSFSWRSVACWLVGGLVGGLLGVLAWVAVAHFLGIEGKWLACAVGLLVGVGVRYSSWRGDQLAESNLEGLISAVIALLCIVAAKYVISLDDSPPTLLVNSAVPHKFVDIRLDEQGLIASLADDIAYSQTKLGESLAWPAGESLQTATEPDDYPPGIWQQAESTWRRMSASEREEVRSRREFAARLVSWARPRNFIDSFGPLDLLWMSLAAITAYKIGVGIYGTDD